jgi:hypothetical protein
MNKEAIQDDGWVIGVDFDGTVVTHEYPNVGKDVGAISVLKKIVEKGNKIIIFTMRSGKELEDAVKWYEDNEIPVYGINVNPTQHTWTASPKAYCEIYIDDAGIFTPLIHNPFYSSRPYVDWFKVEKELIKLSII